MQNLVYLLFPTALALLIAYWMTRTVNENVVSIDITRWPSIIGIVAPFLGIMLYELALDDWLVKSYFRRRASSSMVDLTAVLAQVHLILETWRDESFRPPLKPADKQDELTKMVEAQIQNTVSSYYFHTQLWPIRASIYLLFSIPFFVGSFGLISLDIGMISASHTVILPNLGEIALSVAVSAFSLVVILVALFADRWRRKKGLTRRRYLVPVLVIPLLASVAVLILGPSMIATLACVIADAEMSVIYVQLRRTRNLPNHLMYLIEFYYVQRLVSMWSVVVPQKYEREPKLVMIRRELDSLQEVLNQGDTAVFFPRWSIALRNIISSFRRGYNEFLRTDVFREWTRVMYSRRKKLKAEESTKRLDWLIYYLGISHATPGDIAKEFRLADDPGARLIQTTLTGEYEKGFELSNLSLKGVLSLLPSSLLTMDGNESESAMKISAGLHILYNGSENDHFSNLVGTMISQFGTTSDVGLDPPEVAELVARYTKELYEKKKRDNPAFKDCDFKSFETMYEVVHDEDMREYLLIDFIRGGSMDGLVNMLQNRSAILESAKEKVWREVLEQLPAADTGGIRTKENLRKAIMQAHFVRLFGQFDAAARNVEKIDCMAQAIWWFLSWSLQEVEKGIENGISTRLRGLTDEPGRNLVALWQRRTNREEREALLLSIRGFMIDSGVVEIPGKHART